LNHIAQHLDVNHIARTGDPHHTNLNEMADPHHTNLNETGDPHHTNLNETGDLHHHVNLNLNHILGDMLDIDLILMHNN